MTFLWPKMHSLVHLVESIRAKGVVANTSTDGGEALHPQSKVDYRRTNKQPETMEEQVCRLSLIAVDEAHIF